MSVAFRRLVRALRSVLSACRRPVRTAALFSVAMLAGCSLAPPDGARRGAADGFRIDHPGRYVPASELDVRVSQREQVESESGNPLLRLDFSFVSYDGYVGEDDVLESTGTLYLPLDGNGNVREDGTRVLLLTEFPPGASRSRFPFLAEYGERPADELGIPAAVVDIRGPVVSRLREYVNPDDPAGGVFTGEEQFAYSMLRSFQATGDERFLWEYQAAGAWLRAIRAVTAVLAAESDAHHDLVLLCGERYGAVSAAQAAVVDERVGGVVMAGWPLRWDDYQFVRDRRWAWETNYEPLDAAQPTGYRETRDVLSFLGSTRQAPDPGCPGCVAGGDEWLRQYDVARLRSSNYLRAALFLLEGDEDPDLPIDLTVRATVPHWRFDAAPPHAASAPTAEAGPFATGVPGGFEGLRMLRGGTSTIARADAAETVRAWAQALNGFRDPPVITATEAILDGDLLVTVRAGDSNARIMGVSVRAIESEPSHRWDFKNPLHRDRPASMDWRDVPTHYDGIDTDSFGRWTARIPLSASSNQAYSVSVQTRIGDAETEHSLPVRPLWHFRDPAEVR